jgi:hypothetical protein
MEDPTYELSIILISAIFVAMLMISSLYLIKAMASASIPPTIQEISIGLSELQQINQTYGNNPLMQIAISQAQSNITAIVNSQFSATTQVVNELSYIYDLFHKLLSIKDSLEIFGNIIK